MSAADVLFCMARRWYFVLAGILLTWVGCVATAPGQHVYSARASVVFLWPGSGPVSPTDDTAVPALVNFAAMVRLAVPAISSGSTDGGAFGGSLVGSEVRQGYTLILPNSGGQWSQSYNQPMLAIEAVDLTPEAAERQLTSIMRQIDQATSELQARLNIPMPERVTTTAGTANIDLVDGGVNSGTRLRGVAALAGLGSFLTIVATVVGDHALTRFRRAYIPVRAAVARDVAGTMR
ncbi:hypothetical protein [Sinomonas flava]|uniref:Lipoprotein n=1 Tax=Sinomonas flava TaxID=496857 RepID=A0ABP5NPA9_9MICC